MWPPSAFWRGFVGSATLVLIVLAGLALWHLYTDHLAFHTVLNYLQQHAAAINKLP